MVFRRAQTTGSATPPARAESRAGSRVERVGADELAVRFEAAFRTFLSSEGAHEQEQSFRLLYELLNRRVSAYCYRLAPQLAEDILQEFWERIIRFRKKEKMPVVESPLAFCFTVARNLCLDHLRRTPDHDGLEEVQVAVPSTEPTDLESIVLEALEKLAFEDREVLVLNIYSGYKFGEIAEILGKSQDAIWARASRARIKLRKLVVEEAAKRNIPLPAMEQPLGKQ